jgi:alpha-aminoadipate carrier protein LysW
VNEPSFRQLDGGFSFYGQFALHSVQNERYETMNNQQIECLECGATLQLPADVMQNEIIVCDDCDTELEVMQLDPLEIDYAPEVEEDWGE